SEHASTSQQPLDDASYRIAWGEGEPQKLTSAVGGRTLLWMGCAPRMQPMDFYAWPVGYAELAPYYERAEALLGVCHRTPTDDAIAARLRARGIELAKWPVAMGAEHQAACAGVGLDSAVARLAGSALVGSRRLLVVPNAAATRILFDRSRSRAD